VVVGSNSRAALLLFSSLFLTISMYSSICSVWTPASSTSYKNWLRTSRFIDSQNYGSSKRTRFRLTQALHNPHCWSRHGKSNRSASSCAIWLMRSRLALIRAFAKSYYDFMLASYIARLDFNNSRCCRLDCCVVACKMLIASVIAC